jgi:hypothetical protein
MGDLDLAAPVSPTTDLDAAKADLDEHGYCLVEGLLPPDRRQVVMERLVAQAAAEIEDGTDYVYEGGSNQRVWTLLNKGHCFVELALDPTVLDFMEHGTRPGPTPRPASCGTASSPTTAGRSCGSRRPGSSPSTLACWSAGAGPWLTFSATTTTCRWAWSTAYPAPAPAGSRAAVARQRPAEAGNP